MATRPIETKLKTRARSCTSSTERCGRAPACARTLPHPPPLTPVPGARRTAHAPSAHERCAHLATCPSSVVALAAATPNPPPNARTRPRFHDGSADGEPHTPRKENRTRTDLVGELAEAVVRLRERVHRRRPRRGLRLLVGDERAVEHGAALALAEARLFDAAAHHLLEESGEEDRGERVDELEERELRDQVVRVVAVRAPVLRHRQPERLPLVHLVEHRDLTTTPSRRPAGRSRRVEQTARARVTTRRANAKRARAERDTAPVSPRLDNNATVRDGRSRTRRTSDNKKDPVRGGGAPGGR